MRHFRMLSVSLSIITMLLFCISCTESLPISQALQFDYDENPFSLLRWKRFQPRGHNIPNWRQMRRNRHVQHQTLPQPSRFSFFDEPGRPIMMQF
ncbi:unnamed protein product [Anisakis simplex]|uniref:Secreted protein n=1 Tax=Anisakis simplex TaxID=6269 RepID=A0A0M3JCR9_ANISI|nr:unnamed protein product [Anisakis simplex]